MNTDVMFLVIEFILCYKIVLMFYNGECNRSSGLEITKLSIYIKLNRNEKT